jgi:antitoxin component YwqK of YwqJK toxin-antitoxin module
MATNIRLPLLCIAFGLSVSLYAWAASAEEPTRVAMDLPGAMDASALSEPVPDPDVAPLETPLSQTTNQGVELVTERYSDGSVKIEREVTLDDENNYVNHGSYAMYDRSGKIVRTGEYRMGNQHGQWMQVLSSDAGDLFSGSLNKKFPAPFVSTASFLDGELHGTWTIKGRTEHKIIEWNFEHGVRHGVATWWYPGGIKRCELNYEYGVPVGEFVRYGLDGKVTGRTKYIDGRPLINKVEWHSRTQKQFEGTALAGQESGQPKFDWWNTSAKVEPIPVKVPELKHGAWTVWHANGTVKIQGSYDHGLPVGKFTWWYENGQKQAEGSYESGLQTGTWVTWHPNGMKESVGDYTDGEIVGDWMRWEANGRLVEMQEYGNEAPAQVNAEEGTEDETLQEASAAGLGTEDFDAEPEDASFDDYWADDFEFE